MTSTGIHISASSMATAVSSIPKDTPILMLNLLRFRPSAKYPAGTDLPTATGKDAYLTRYIPAFQSIAASVSESIQPFWFAAPMAHLVGPPDVNADGKEEKWDVAALVRYPSFQAFQDVTGSERYEEDAKMHRLASLEDWRLIATVELTVEQALA